MKTYLLEREALIPAPVAEVWSFFSDPHNLARITPGYLRFRVLRCPDTDKIYEGMLIEYRVSPVPGIPLRWVTLIRSVRDKACFMDKQLEGPYKLWEHTHTFEAHDRGTLMKDSVRYALPFGFAGRWLHRLWIRRQLEGIFNYREEVIRKLFPS